MKSFILQLTDSQKELRVENVTSFVGEDESGSFGILPGHAHMMTVLVFGLARFKHQDGPWEYLAMPGAVLQFADNILRIVCRHYLIDEEYDRISYRLMDELVAEEEQLREVRESLQRMEEALFKHMWDMKRQGVKL